MTKSDMKGIAIICLIIIAPIFIFGFNMAERKYSTSVENATTQYKTNGSSNFDGIEVYEVDDKIIVKMDVNADVCEDMALEDFTILSNAEKIFI